MKTRIGTTAAGLLTLLLLTGCSTTQQVYLPGEMEDPTMGQIEIIEVEVGQEATVFLESGEKVKGDVVEVDLNRIVLGKPGNYGYQDSVYYAVEISRIEASRSTGFGRAAGGVVMGATLVFMALVIAVGLSEPINFGQ